ncbi:nicotinate-nucleotide--dimethylbenzimidazole phosphoribosyltransferase [Streptomyces sulfonofaciens]|uniref:Nicotinate-nucleotide--dimethylbenzimidazole phosphoribosyltransferase n=1 Tax=Streptomyces sulfonofaciens TaxID=68272 RepID=A0A919KWV8_9ACTN|nr:nicotinate-nucleotide--dimethylbenzimidazole phosphoribosyltransferase [Streptomyces sulfonofaciens]GHH75627.1 nicotinate-nucleotide--dimethylbenzimidazole phosphoribosyltransferase [Streptomyces sulfonofaciens]
MTETGQIPAEGLPENAGNGVASGPAPGPEARHGAPAPDGHPFADPSAAHHADDDMLLMPIAQGAWTEGQPHTGAAHGEPVPAGAPGAGGQTPQAEAAQAGAVPSAAPEGEAPAASPAAGAAPAAEAGSEPGPQDTAGRDTAGPAPAPQHARRPLHLGPPVPDATSTLVRTLADRGPASAPAPQPAPAPGPEYPDTPVDDPTLAGPQLGALPPHGGAPWSPHPQPDGAHAQAGPEDASTGQAPLTEVQAVGGDAPQTNAYAYAAQETHPQHAQSPGYQDGEEQGAGVEYAVEGAGAEYAADDAGYPVDGAIFADAVAHAAMGAGHQAAPGQDAHAPGAHVNGAGAAYAASDAAHAPYAMDPAVAAGVLAGAGPFLSAAHPGALPDGSGTFPAAASEAQPVGQFVPVAGSVPTTPHLAPTPPHALTFPQPPAETTGAQAFDTAAGGYAPEAGAAEAGGAQDGPAEQPAFPAADGSGPLPAQDGMPGAAPQQAEQPLEGPVAAGPGPAGGGALPEEAGAAPSAAPGALPEAEAAQAVEHLEAGEVPEAVEHSEAVDLHDGAGAAETVEAVDGPGEPEIPAAPEIPATPEAAAGEEAGPGTAGVQAPHPAAAAGPENGSSTAEEAVIDPQEASAAELPPQEEPPALQDPPAQGAQADGRPTVPAPRDGEQPHPVPPADAAQPGAPAPEMPHAPEQPAPAPAAAEQPVPEPAAAAPEQAGPQEAPVPAAPGPDLPAPEAQAPGQPPQPPVAPEPQGPPAAGYDEAEREAVLRVMRERRDIRNGFRNDPIPPEVLLRVLEAAHAAPSVGHSQPWDFVVIRSAETRRAMHELAMHQREVYAKSLPKARAKAFRELKVEAILDTPVNIVVTADPTRGGRHTLGRYTQPQMAPYSSALAVENLWLAARAEGLGVGWVSFFDEREMVRALGLPEHLHVVAYLCVGYVDEFPKEPELMQAGWAKRRPLSWVVHEETYGRRALPGSEPHDLLAETIAGIRPLDAKALGEAWERQKRMTKPSGALGMLEIISAQLSGLSRMCPPPVPEPAAVAIFAGDHGVHAQGVTPWPQEVTGQMVANFLGGGAVCNAFANQVGAEVCVIDVGVAADLPATPGLLPRKVRPGTRDMTVGPALTREEVKAAIEVGIETARDLVAAGNKVLLTGEMGIANTTPSAALISVFTGAEPAEVTGRGTGINDETLTLKTEVVRRALELHQPDPTDPIGVLAAVGGLEHAAIAGLLLGGASLRTPVVLDGVSAGAAALVARAIAPEVLAACIAGHRSAEPGHVVALNKLGLRPLVDLDLRLGEGTGALLALPIIQSAARAMHEVATFDAAGVTEK